MWYMCTRKGIGCEVSKVLQGRTTIAVALNRQRTRGAHDAVNGNTYTPKVSHTLGLGFGLRRNGSGINTIIPNSSTTGCVPRAPSEGGVHASF